MCCKAMCVHEVYIFPVQALIHCDTGVDVQATARILSSKDGKIDALMQEILSLRSSLRDRERTISSFHAQAEALIHVDHKFLDVAVKDMYAQVVLGQGKSGKKLRSKPAHEVIVTSTGVAPVGAAGSGKSGPSGMSATVGAGKVGLGSTVPAVGSITRVRQDSVSIKEHLETVEGAVLSVTCPSRLSVLCAYHVVVLVGEWDTSLTSCPASVRACTRRQKSCVKRTSFTKASPS
jgi:hypothetical protein